MNPSGSYNGQPDYSIMDGFVLLSSYRCDLRFRNIVIDEYEPLRRAGGFRVFNLVFPLDSRVQIPAYDALEGQIKTKPGACYWAYLFLATAGLYSLKVTDGCTGTDLWSQEVVASPKSAKQCPLSRLLIVPAMGLLNVQICSLNSVAASGVQFVLWGGQPAA